MKEGRKKTKRLGSESRTTSSLSFYSRRKVSGGEGQHRVHHCDRPLLCFRKAEKSRARFDKHRQRHKVRTPGRRKEIRGDENNIRVEKERPSLGKARANSVSVFPSQSNSYEIKRGRPLHFLLHFSFNL
jgi:hypothetical protein